MLFSLLAANLAFAAVAWLAGLGAERLKLPPIVRVRLWTCALLCAAAIPPALFLIDVLHIPSPVRIPVLEQVAVLPTLSTAAIRHGPPAAAPMAPLQAHRTLPFNLQDAVLMLLAAGLSVRLISLARGYHRLTVLVSQSEPIEDPALRARVTKIANRFCAWMADLRQADVSTPLVLRYPRAILLPRTLTGKLDLDSLSLVCGHELAHLKRGDDATMEIYEFLACLYWFNPFMAAIDRRLSAAREEVCDRMAMGSLSRERRQAYARTLVSTFSLCSGASMAPAFLGRRGNPARQRLMAVLEPARPSTAKAAAMAALGLALAAGAGGLSLAVAGATPKPAAIAAFDSWLVPNPSDGLTDADRAWLIMRSVQNDIATQVRNLAKAPDPARMSAFIQKSRAQVAEIERKIDGKPISQRAREIDRENNLLRDQQWAKDDQWDRPPAAGKVRATVFCAPDRPCQVKSVDAVAAKAAPSYGAWAVRYAEALRENQMPHLQKTDGFLVKADLTPAVLTKPPSPQSGLDAFFGMGPEGMPLDVVPPPET